MSMIQWLLAGAPPQRAVVAAVCRHVTESYEGQSQGESENSEVLLTGTTAPDLGDRSLWPVIPSQLRMNPVTIGVEAPA